MSERVMYAINTEGHWRQREQVQKPQCRHLICVSQEEWRPAWVEWNKKWVKGELNWGTFRTPDFERLWWVRGRTGLMMSHWSHVQRVMVWLEPSWNLLGCNEENTLTRDEEGTAIKGQLLYTSGEDQVQNVHDVTMSVIHLSHTPDAFLKTELMGFAEGRDVSCEG